MTLVCCTSKPADKTSIASQTVAADTTEVTSTDTTSIVRSLDEDFIAFIKRFHTDTTFQRQRVCDVIHGYNSGDDTTLYCDYPEGVVVEISSDDYTWDNEVIGDCLRYFDMALTDSTYSRTILLKSDTVIKENIFIMGSGTNHFLTFKRRENKWFLTEIDYSVL